jgi:hypothetical protein
MSLNLLYRFLYQFKKVIKKLTCYTTVHVLGDSHTEVFSFMQYFPFYAWHMDLEVCTVHGATASGLANPNSKTNAKVSFENYCDLYVKKDDIVLLELGEVDCGFAIWYRAEKKTMKIQEQLDMALENYFKLIERVAKKCDNKVIICSTILPTIMDSQDFGEIANLRTEVKATQREGTELTLRFNAYLKNFAESSGFYFLNLDKHILNPLTGTVFNPFLNTNKLNHHLRNSRLAPILEKELKSILKTMSR